ncbi:hypothetical protein LCL87_17105 [Rhodococcus hoagii]|nr:hypothetical protein [Prescottella equi]
MADEDHDREGCSMKPEVSPDTCRLAGSYIEACVLGDVKQVMALYQQAQPVWDEFVVAGLWLTTGLAAAQGKPVPHLYDLIADDNRESKMEHLIWKVVGTEFGAALKVGRMARGDLANEALRSCPDWDPSTETNLDDARTAVAVLMHHTAGDPRAVAQLVADAENAGHAFNLVHALAELCVRLNPDLATDEGRAELQQIALGLACPDSDEADPAD